MITWITENIWWLLPTAFSAIIAAVEVWYRIIRPHFDEKKQAKLTLRVSLDKFISRWEIFKETPDINRFGKGKMQGFLAELQYLGDSILEVVSRSSKILSNDTISKAFDIGKGIRRLGQKEFSINGGKTWSEFSIEGDKLLERSRECVSKL